MNSTASSGATSFFTEQQGTEQPARRGRLLLTAVLQSDSAHVIRIKQINQGCAAPALERPHPE